MKHIYTVSESIPDVVMEEIKKGRGVRHEIWASHHWGELFDVYYLYGDAGYTWDFEAMVTGSENVPAGTYDYIGWQEKVEEEYLFPASDSSDIYLDNLTARGPGFFGEEYKLHRIEVGV